MVAAHHRLVSCSKHLANVLVRQVLLALVATGEDGQLVALVLLSCPRGGRLECVHVIYAATQQHVRHVEAAVVGRGEDLDLAQPLMHSVERQFEAARDDDVQVASRTLKHVDWAKSLRLRLQPKQNLRDGLAEQKVAYHAEVRYNSSCLHVFFLFEKIILVFLIFCQNPYNLEKNSQFELLILTQCSRMTGGSAL